MALTILEKASLNRLRKNIQPLDNQIVRAREKAIKDSAALRLKAEKVLTDLNEKLDKIQTDFDKFVEEIETQKAIYLVPIQHLEAKEREEETAAEVTEAVAAQEVTPEGIANGEVPVEEVSETPQEELPAEEGVVPQSFGEEGSNSFDEVIEAEAPVTGDEIDPFGEF